MILKVQFNFSVLDLYNIFTCVDCCFAFSFLCVSSYRARFQWELSQATIIRWEQLWSEYAGFSKQGIESKDFHNSTYLCLYICYGNSWHILVKHFVILCLLKIKQEYCCILWRISVSWDVKCPLFVKSLQVCVMEQNPKDRCTLSAT